MAWVVIAMAAALGSEQDHAKAAPWIPAWVARGPMLPTAQSGPATDGSGLGGGDKVGRHARLVVAGPEGLRLINRSGRDVTTSFSELRALADALGSRRVVLDSEIVALGPGGQPDFGRLQLRIHRARPTAVQLRDTPARLYVFDLLYLDDTGLLNPPVHRPPRPTRRARPGARPDPSTRSSASCGRRPPCCDPS
ncbi:hypothetical protein [Saccharopolyspora thermophila]